MSPRQFIFAPVVLSRYNRVNGTTFPVNAASNKVMGMVAGLRSQASPSFIVSSPIVTASRGLRYFGSLVCRDQRLACAYLPAISVRGLNRIFAAFVYLGFALRRIERGDCVVFYNYFPEYVPVAIFLRWRLGRDLLLAGAREVAGDLLVEPQAPRHRLTVEDLQVQLELLPVEVELHRPRQLRV